MALTLVGAGGIVGFVGSNLSGIVDQKTNSYVATIGLYVVAVVGYLLLWFGTGMAAGIGFLCQGRGSGFGQQSAAFPHCNALRPGTFRRHLPICVPHYTLDGQLWHALYVVQSEGNRPLSWRRHRRGAVDDCGASALYLQREM